MKAKVVKTGIALGVGALGYWVYREFLKSDRTIRGTVGVMGEDVKAGVNSGRSVFTRAFSALRAAMQDWRKEIETDSLFANPSRLPRGNGSARMTKTDAFPTTIEEHQ